ncbi:hypothetical protein MTO96_032102, partial [Rhipicephalus appendiculatus]
AVIVLINHLERQQDKLCNSYQGSSNHQKEEMIPMDNVTGSSIVDESNSLSGYLNCSSTQLDQSPSKAKRVYTISSATQRKPNVGAAASSPATGHPASHVASAERPRDESSKASITSTFQQESSVPKRGQVHPDFSGCYDNEEYPPSHRFEIFGSDCSIPSAPPAQ